ncbi:MAG TPA: haloacid dehalogenase type II [Terriglobales bacterium]|nr:haloacid dehalogenase type II [Terriglobales bacterium]
MLDFSQFSVLSFDCYGTMIDWESGIFSALRPVLKTHKKEISDAALLELYAELEFREEQEKFQNYRDVLQAVMRGLGGRLGFKPTDAEVRSLPDSIANWRPFPDTVEALQRLKTRYRLAVISNIDDDLFALSAPKLRVKFDEVITAQQARCYKPGERIFRVARERIGVDPAKWLHVGQSVYHDVIPAKSLGLATVWVNRPSPRAGAGATQAAIAKPDVEVPSLAALADLIGIP